MRKLGVLFVLAAAFVAGSCQQGMDPAGPWFDGGFDAALVEAGARGSLLMMEFYSDT